MESIRPGFFHGSYWSFGCLEIFNVSSSLHDFLLENSWRCWVNDEMKTQILYDTAFRPAVFVHWRRKKIKHQKKQSSVMETFLCLVFFVGDCFADSDPMG